MIAYHKLTKKISYPNPVHVETLFHPATGLVVVTCSWVPLIFAMPVLSVITTAGLAAALDEERRCQLNGCV